MAITFDSVAHGSSSGDPGTITFSMTVNSGSNRLLVVAYAGRSVGVALSTVTFNGVSLTGPISGTAINNNTFQTEIWYLVAPDVITANVVVTPGAGTHFRNYATAQSFFGVDPVSPLDDAGSTDSSGSTPSTISLSDLTTVINGSAVVDVFLSNSSAGTMTSETNRTERYNEGSEYASSSIVTKTTAGAVTMQWQMLAGSAAAVMAGAAFAPQTATPLTQTASDDINDDVVLITGGG